MLNLFDPADDPSLHGEFEDLKLAVSPQRCERLAEAIKIVDADIIALQEIESLEALTWFRDAWLPDAGYQYLASIDVGNVRGIECSVMSRFKITDTRVWLNESLDNVERPGSGWAEIPADAGRLTFQRSPLMVKVTTDSGYRLTIFALHHKSGPPFNYQREAEAARIVELIREVQKDDPAQNVVVMGDFNAAPSDKSVRLYLAAGLIDSMAHRVWQGDSPEVSLYKTHESNRVLDYILLNSAAHRELVIGSAFVYGTLRPPPGYDHMKDPDPPALASDHYPVAIELMPHEQP
jgi:endonuclease/exonuclease/phosphatase family metal-dependent hydrolase